MPSSVVVLALRDTVVAALNDTATYSWSQTFTAQGCYVPDLDLKDLETLKVLVGSRSRMQKPLTRGRSGLISLVDVEIAVGVFKRVATDTENLDGFDHDEVDALLLLCQEIGEKLARLSVADPQFTVQAVASDPVFDPMLLAEHKRFEGVIVLTFSGSR